MANHNPGVRVGLALGSGAARGWGHIGVIRALEEAGYVPAWVAGTSMGALVGAMYAAGKLDELEDFARSLTPSRVMSYLDLVVPVRGLLQGDKVRDMLRGFLGELSVDRTLIPFCAVSTDLASGREMRLLEGNLVDAVYASIAIPGIFVPATYDGRFLVDGGLSSPVPVEAVRALGAGRIIAVDLNHNGGECDWCPPRPASGAPARPRAMAPRPAPGANEAAHALALAATQGQHRLKLGVLERRYREMETALRERTFRWIMRAPRPNVFDVIGSSINMVTIAMTRVTLAKSRPDLVICPALGQFNLWDFHDAAPAIAEGYASTRQALEQQPLLNASMG
ncbi:MAG: patatin-like phospholipase family protein [Nitrospirota bacterium]|nr:patatin-like phospholipase family protein [Nitrospirota bacterium]